MGPQKSTEQCNIFVKFMEKHPDMAKGFSKGDKVKQEQLWIELTNQLNACGLPHRDVVVWKKTWCDWRRSIKTRLAENKCFLNKTEGGNFQQHYLSPNEEQIAIICDIFYPVEGEPNGKSFGARKRKASSLQAAEEANSSSMARKDTPAPTCSTTSPPITPVVPPMTPIVPPLPDSPETTHEIPSQPKRKQFAGDIQDVIGAEENNFKRLGKKIDLLTEQIKSNGNYLKDLNRNLSDIRSIKKKSLEAKQRHYNEMQKIAVSRNEMKLEFLKLEQMKMGVSNEEFI